MAAKSSRLEVRLTPQALDLIRDAAGAQQQDVTSFVLGAAVQRAREVLLESRVLRLTPAEVTQLERHLDAQGRSVPELAALIERYGGAERS